MSSLFFRRFLPFLNETRHRLVVTRLPVRHYSPSWGPPRATIDRKDIEFRVLQSLGKHDKIDLNSVSVDSELARDLGLDSLDLIECVVQLEDEFQVEVNDRDLDKLTSVRAVVTYLVALMESRVDQNQRPDIEFGENMTMNRPVN